MTRPAPASIRFNLSPKGWIVGAAVFCSLAISFGCRAESDLFNGGRILRIQLQVPPESLKSLRESSRTYVSVAVREGTNFFPNVAVHLKGRLGSFRPLN